MVTRHMAAFCFIHNCSACVLAGMCVCVRGVRACVRACVRAVCVCCYYCCCSCCCSYLAHYVQSMELYFYVKGSRLYK